DERNAAVRPIFDGEIPSGMELSWESLPDQVRLTGAENVISRLQTVYTAPIPLTDAPEFFEFDPALNLPPGVTAAPRRVRFRIRLVRKVSRRSMQLPAAVLVSPGSALSAAIVSAPKNGIEVNLRGPAAKLADLPPDRVRLFVDATGISAPGRRRLPVRCHGRVPEIVPVSIVPAELEVQFTRNTSEINKKRKEK
ncbi:MAG: YbbR-like domain-containing protein, partial [Lentisphaeria bacterium]|nr:YbbR-like domain-containing protein [Lentisphaeria bacterium]